MFVDCDLLTLLEPHPKFASVLAETIIAYSRFYYDCDITLGMTNLAVKTLL